MKIKGFRELNVWKKSIELAELVYDLTKSFPKDEAYGLSSQIRRSVVSVASNIAEGSARNNTKEFIQFLGIAKGSLAEVETQLVISQKRKYSEPEKYSPIFLEINHIDNMIHKLIDTLKGKSNG